jgi:putative ABC transport system permease protein
VGYNAVSAEYFSVLGIPVVRGRPLDERDVAGAPPVAVVNEALARRFFPGQDPVGRLVGSGSDTDAPPLRIVGVVGDVRRTGLDSEPLPELFFSLAQDATPSPVLLVRAEAAVAASLPASARRLLRELDRELPLYAVRPLADLVADTIAPRRIVLALLAAFSSCALLLAAAGVYGVVAQSVVLRRQEIGLRLAVGASASHVLRMVMREGMRPVAIGAVFGAAASSALGRSVAALLHGVTPLDPLTHAAALVLVAGVGAAACFVPARRAAALEPGQTLRSD